MTDSHQTYILSMRAIGLLLLCVAVVGAIGGTLGGWAVARRTIDGETGQRIIQRVEQPARDPSATFARVVDTVRPSVLHLLGSTGASIGNAVVLTGDGLALGLLPSDRTIPRQAVRADGSRVPIAFVREYEELGLILFRVPGIYQAPQLLSSADIRPGVQGIAVGLRENADDVRTASVAIESVIPPSQNRLRNRGGLGPLAVVTPSLEDTFLSAPVWNGDGQLLGMLLRDEEGSAMVLGGDLDTILQDTLRHPTGEDIRVLGGLRGSWISRRSAREQSLASEIAFVVDTPSAALTTADGGLKKGDIVISADGDQFTDRTSLWILFLTAARNKQTLTLGVTRDGAPQSVTLSPTVESRASPSPAHRSPRGESGPRPSS